MKKYKILLSYYFRRLRRRLCRAWPIILFAVSLILFFSVLIPNFRCRLPLIGEWPRVLQVSGSVLIEAGDAKSSRLMGARGANIEIGGYKTTTDEHGRFHIKFVSRSSTNIPVIITWRKNMAIKRISFRPDQFEISAEFLLHEN